jgi:hypothetical protein
MIRHGIGVLELTLMSAIILGMCPFLAPTKKMREEAKMPPLTAPNVEQATNKGIVQAITPMMRLANDSKCTTQN